MAFLAFIERDLCEHPERVRELPQALLDRFNDLLGNAAIDLDAPIEDAVAL